MTGPGDDVGAWTSVALNAGQGRIAYQDVARGALKLAAEKDGVVQLDAMEDAITIQHVFELVLRLKQITNFDPLTGESAKFGQNGPRMGSFNAFGAGYLSRVVGEKKAREFWLLCRTYNAQEALQMGLVNWVVPDDKLDAEVEKVCDEILALSPTALKCMKLHFQQDTDKYEGLWEIGRYMAVMYQRSPEAKEGMAAFLEKRKPDFWKHVEPL